MNRLVTKVSVVVMSVGVLSTPATARDLEITSIQDFRVEEVLPGRQLRISGENMESAWPIKSVRVKRVGTNVFVRVKLKVFFGAVMEGPLNQLIPIDSTVQHVYFGKKRALIWQRSS